MMMTSRVPSSSCEMTSERRASDARPPAFLMWWASPSWSPVTAEVSLRVSNPGVSSRGDWEGRGNSEHAGIHTSHDGYALAGGERQGGLGAAVSVDARSDRMRERGRANLGAKAGSVGGVSSGKVVSSVGHGSRWWSEEKERVSMWGPKRLELRLCACEPVAARHRVRVAQSSPVWMEVLALHRTHDDTLANDCEGTGRRARTSVASESSRGYSIVVV